jgi:hypothetical protein
MNRAIITPLFEKIILDEQWLEKMDKEIDRAMNEQIDNAIDEAMEKSMELEIGSYNEHDWESNRAWIQKLRTQLVRKNGL